ncbi:MAG: UDP-N-acetylmuramoyl-tripeptide--D-alanyl-D-alanine ligase [Bdellovibrionia bacterium]
MSWKLNLADLAFATKGKILSTKQSEFTGVSTDGRADNAGKLFIPLKGDKFDAHDFIGQALDHGARAFLTNKPLSELKFTVPQKELTVVQVADTLTALQELGRFWRRQLKIKVIGITGTNGKTTTREFTQVLTSAKFPTYAAKGSFNNHFGVPMSLLEAEPEHKLAIIEMGMNHPGELKRLVEIAEPDIVLVTMVGRGHLEGMGSVEAVAKEKEEIYKWSARDAIRIFNLDNTHTKAMRSRAPSPSKVLTFSSQDESATVHFKETLSTLEYLELTGKIAGVAGQARVPVFGSHNLNNLMAAASAAVAAGVEPEVIWRALPNCKSTWGRNQLVELSSGARLIFDAYNANPESMGAALDNVARLSVKGKRLLVLGEMLEMGDHASALHEELGGKVGLMKPDFVWFVGPHKDDFARGVRGSAFNKSLVVSDGYEEKLALELSRMIKPDDIILVKGSRGMKLERVVSALDPGKFKTTY